MFKYYMSSAFIGWAAAFFLTKMIFGGAYELWSDQAHNVFISYIFIIVMSLCTCVGVHKKRKEAEKKYDDLNSKQAQRSSDKGIESHEKDQEIKDLKKMIKLMMENKN